MNSQEVIRLLSVLTLASNITLGAFILFFLLNKLGFFKKQWDLLIKKISPRVTLGAFIISATATLGSLYLSEIAHFEPCKLCWFQRIFMYPLPIILGTSLWRNKKDVWQYVLPLSIIGLAIALYHYYYQINPEGLIPCSTVGFSVSCSERFFTHFGYITIPFMSLTAFFLITFFMLFLRDK